MLWSGHGQLPAGPPPPRGNRKLIAAVAAAVAVVAVVTGAVLWGLNSGGGQSASTTTAAPPVSTSPSGIPTPGTSTPASPAGPPPPLGALRPPHNLQVSSLEQAPRTPRWTLQSGGNPKLMGGDSEILILGNSAGIIAVDAATGKARWTAPALPDGVDSGYFLYSQCAVDRAHTTIGCALNLSSGKDEIVAFFDANTGAIKSRTVMPQVSRLHDAGDGFVLVQISSDITGYHSDGSLAWKASHDGVAVYGDQGIIVTRDGRVLDANTGAVIVEYPGIANRGKTAFATGFALSNTQSIDFFDFTGKKTASIEAGGFGLLDGDRELTGSSGLYYPLLYKEATGELRAVDPATGQQKWTRQLGVGPADDVRGYGSDTTCFVLVGGDSGSRVKAEPCESVGNNGFASTEAKTISDAFIGFDGQRIAFYHLGDVVCVDATTGQEVWRTHELHSPEWVGDGLYSVTFDDELVRWA